jgi:hypothetical protein
MDTNPAMRDGFQTAKYAKTSVSIVNRQSLIVNPDAPLANLAKLLHKQDFRDGL